MALILFGDVILPMVWHAFILLLEVMEALMDHALEMVFGLDPWTAQLITAWSGFFAAVSVAVLAVRKAKALFRRCRSRLEGWWEEHFTRS